MQVLQSCLYEDTTAPHYQVPSASSACPRPRQQCGRLPRCGVPTPSDDELQPTKFPKRAGKGAGKLEKRPREPQTAPPRGPKQAHLLTLARMMARHEMALQQLRGRNKDRKTSAPAASDKPLWGQCSWSSKRGWSSWRPTHRPRPR